MLVLRGTAALSQFRIDKLFASAKARCPRIDAIATAYQYFVDTTTVLSGLETDVLESLLHHGSEASAAPVG